MVEVEPPRSEDRAKPVEEPRHRREAKFEMRKRDLGRLRRQHRIAAASSVGSCAGISAFPRGASGAGPSGSTAHPRPRAGRRASSAAPGSAGTLQPPRELLGSLRGLEALEIRLPAKRSRAFSSSSAATSTRNSPQASRSSSSRSASRSTNVRRFRRCRSQERQLLPQDEGQQQVERPLERVEVELELADSALRT